MAREAERTEADVVAPYPARGNVNIPYGELPDDEQKYQEWKARQRHGGSGFPYQLASNDPSIAPPPPGLPPNLTAPNIAPEPQQAKGTIQSYLDTLGPPQDPREVQSKMDEAQAEIKKQNEITAGRMEQNIAQQNKLINQPTPQVPVPRLHDIPRAPQFQYRDAFQVFQSPAILLATLGSMFTRRSAVNALTAGAGALNGFMEGDKAKVEREEQNWKNAVEATIKQNDVETKEFNMIMDNTKLSVDDKNAKLRALYAANQNELGLNALRTGDATLTYKQNEATKLSTEKLREALIKAQVVDDRRAQGLFSQEDYQLRAAQALKGDYRGAFQGLGTGFQRAENIRGILAAARAQNPDMTPQQVGQLMAAANQSYAASTSAMRTVLSRVKNLEAIQNEMKEQIPSVIESSKKVPRGKFVPLNKLIQEGKIQTSNPDLYEFATANLQLAELWARSYNPTGVMRIEDRKLALDKLGTATDHESWLRVVKTIERGINANIRGANKTIRNFNLPEDAELPAQADAPQLEAVDEQGNRWLWDGNAYVDPVTREPKRAK